MTAPAIVLPPTDAEPDLATVARTCSFCGDITAAADIKRRWGRVICGWCLHQAGSPKVLTPAIEHAIRPWTPAHLEHLMAASRDAAEWCKSTDRCWEERSDVRTSLYCLETARPHQRRYLIQRLRHDASLLASCAPQNPWADDLRAAIDRTEDHHAHD